MAADIESNGKNSSTAFAMPISTFAIMLVILVIGILGVFSFVSKVTVTQIKFPVQLEDGDYMLFTSSANGQIEQYLKAHPDETIMQDGKSLTLRVRNGNYSAIQQFQVKK